MNEIRNERILADERLHPAIFIVPVFVAAATALPTFLVLLLIHVFTTMLTNLIALFTNQQITLFNGYFYIFSALPTFLLTGIAFLVTLISYLKSTITLTNRRPEGIVTTPRANVIVVPDPPSREVTDGAGRWVPLQ